MARELTSGTMNGLEEEIAWKKTALLVIDMQNDFILPGGPVCVAGGADIVPAVQKAVEVAREKGAFVVWVLREHHSSGRDVEFFRKHFYENGKKGPTIKGSSGAALVEGLVPSAGEHVIVKSRFSAFFATNLDLVLRRAGISNIVIVGVQTPNCIRATVFDAVALDYPSVSVLADATAAANPSIHTANLLDIQNVGVATPTLATWSGQKASNDLVAK
ncbi:hypothetical protein O6H91_16G087400 [Diphasiastrum complanatum]|uniref:Uncharacterized protein n=6 Tax=Diphasiastrum complanatum TaxID=34168 RepID=A0ACC2BEG1_DIPCM|nr:hypothetical protein O6H91_16G086700 [Diphasiastrum complanatum]KAJ7528167.1 hypothetical protein O6H91_16G087400 [Diphasiastrum complanatum]KAJ7528168.1 hypothetical protein O6H91_16G087400 [Diphasiastrum complanatum]KAJ7528169.1 hypothetical protein O6H91_16G087400 [Diphasiastrum complanatum]KAJ7528170.1 hypothetical protein O6H91_16G087400 [Diphasiastrum complanatum]